MVHGKTDEFPKDALSITLNGGLTRKQVVDDLCVGLSHGTSDLNALGYRCGFSPEFGS